ncbi:MAG: magnesium transporter CorA family protein [bacterium]|nr:magnesium transporter CorA family protein [bacterium]
MHKTYQVNGGRIAEILDADPAQLGQVTAYVNPDEAERKELVERYCLDEHTLFSSLDPDELSRLEFEPEHVAFIFKRPKNVFTKEQFLFRVESTGLFLFKERLIIVISEDIPLFTGKEFNRIKSLTDLTLKLISRSIIHFREHLKVISMISDELQNKINTSMENSHLLNMFSLEKSLEYYLNSINSNGLLFERIKYYAARIGFTTEELELLDDIIVENSQCSKQAEIYSNILASLMDARASIVSNNLNVLMKTLNIITIAIMVPTFVVSAFSMNVGIPMQHHPFAFYIIMGIAMVSVLAFIFFWRYRKW